MPIFFNMSGIPGDATHAGYQGWMDIQSMTWNVSRNVNTLAGVAANREASEPTISEVTLTKISDSSTTSLFQKACTGTSGVLAKIDLVTTGNAGVKYLEYTLHDALIAGYTVGSSGDRPTESIALNFTQMDVTYFPFDQNNQAGAPMRATYNVATAEVS